jgi:hypothetical protein
MDSGVAQALTLMSKHNSENCKELIASIYLVLSEEVENRGKLVAAGGAKVWYIIASILLFRRLSLYSIFFRR